MRGKDFKNRTKNNCENRLFKGTRHYFIHSDLY